MGKSIYGYYKDRLYKASGNSKCLYFSSTENALACDIGNLLIGRDGKFDAFKDFLHGNRKSSFNLITKKEQKAFIDLVDKQNQASYIPDLANAEQTKKIALQNARVRRDELKKEFEKELTTVKSLKRECEEIEKEIGRNELFIAYPFVFGTVIKGEKVTPIKAPLLLFPVRIDITDNGTIRLYHDTAEKILLNPALISAYSYAKKLNTDTLIREFSSLEGFDSLQQIIDYLYENRIKIEYTSSNNIYGYSRFKEPGEKEEFSIRHAAILSRFSLSDPIYDDYTALEKKNDTNSAINLITSDTGMGTTIFSKVFSLLDKFGKSDQLPQGTYHIDSLDYSQFETVKKSGEGGSISVHTPPCTDCAKVCANIIADALCKKKRILLVSAKKNALDSIYNALGAVKDNCVYINDESTEKASFYKKCYAAHDQSTGTPLIDTEKLMAMHAEITEEILSEEQKVTDYFLSLSKERPFGISLEEMYNTSHNIIGRPSDLELYANLIKNNTIMSLDYRSLKNAIDKISTSDLAKDYFDLMQEKKQNPLLTLLRDGIDPRTLKEAGILVKELSEKNRHGFVSENYPYFSQVMEYYKDFDNEEIIDSAIKKESQKKHAKKLFTSKIRSEIKAEFLDTHAAICEFAKDYEPLRKIFTENGYVEILTQILLGNFEYHTLVYDATAKYAKIKKLEAVFKQTDNRILSILDFAYKYSKDRRQYNELPEKILPIRIYYELVRYESSLKPLFDGAQSLSEFKEKVLRLDERARAIASKLTDSSRINEYSSVYASEKNCVEYLKEISKKEDFLPIKRTVDLYERLILSLYPCWLLSPENVSTLLPLKKNMFDVVIFDGASQMFIEEAIPSIYRAKNIVVMGDGMQIHPSLSFIRRTLGSDDNIDLTESTDFHAESLYDIAARKLPLSHLTYHYGIECGELIDFSNRAFYSSEINIAPKNHKKQRLHPIEIHRVDGTESHGCNEKEAKKVIDILSEMSKKKRNTGSIGIITFTKEQQNLIISYIEDAMKQSEELAAFINKEKARINGGEDFSLFVKTVENAQGEKRDNIILSPSLAPNSISDPILTRTLSPELMSYINVAITRAKNKFIFVTSLDACDINDSEPSSAALTTYKKFLSYIKASASGQKKDVISILSELDSTRSFEFEKNENRRTDIAGEIKEKLEKMGYNVKLHPGGPQSKVSIAIYDDKKDRYLVGAILDTDAFSISPSSLEREVYYPAYLELMGWTIVRITSRDWWTNPKKVLTTMIEAAEYNRSEIKNT